MKGTELIEKLGYQLVTGPEEGFEFSTGFTSDLLSDVMANAEDESLLITIQAHKNSVAVASLLGMPAIIICSGRNVPDDMSDAAKEQGIAILRTDNNQFQTSAEIAALLSA